MLLKVFEHNGYDEIMNNKEWSQHIQYPYAVRRLRYLLIAP